MGLMGLTSNVNKFSAWDFVTFGSGGVSVGYVAVEGGQMILKSPAGKDVTFIYGGAGAGLSVGLKIPKLGKIQIPTPKGPLTGSGGPMAFPSTGKVLAADNLPGGDLSESDISGLCMFAEVAGGIIGGGSGTAMFIGLNPIYLSALVGLPSFGAQLLLNTARGMILMAGLNVGTQAQIGGAVYLGYLG